MDFGGRYAAIIEYNSVALSFHINDGRLRRFESAVRFLQPTTPKLLVRRSRFLVSRELRCIPITPDDVRLGFELLSAFTKEHAPKANFRNTWNDILILSACMNRQGSLRTED